MRNHRTLKTPRPARVPAPFTDTALALHTPTTLDQAEGLLGASQGDGDLATYGCELISRGWPYTEARTIVLWLTATGGRPPAPYPKVTTAGALKGTAPDERILSRLKRFFDQKMGRA